MRYGRPSTIVLVAVLAGPPGLAGQQRVDPQVEGPAVVVEALSPFAADPDSSRVAEILADDSLRPDFPATGYDRVLVARLWRRAGETDLAMSELGLVDADDEAMDLAWLEAARVLFEAGDASAGDRAYRSACGSSDPRVLDWIAWDLLPVTTPDEREDWAEVEPGEAACAWLEAFWSERAMRAAVGRRDRLRMHYERLAEARDEFRLDEPRLTMGMTDAYGRPPGLAIDDRGLLLVRMGRPEVDLSCPELVAPDGLPNLTGRCWIYWRPGGYRVFYLSTRDRFGVDLPYGDYRIQENLGQQAEPGTELFQKYVMNSDLSDDTKRRLVRRGPVYRNARLGEVGFDMARDELSRDLGDAESLALRRQVRDATRELAAEVLESISDAPAIEPTLSLRYEPLRFLNPSSGAWQVWLVASVRAGDLAAEDGGERRFTGRVSLLAGETLSEVSLPVQSVPAGTPDEAGVVIRGSTEARPGVLPLTLVVEDLEAPGAGGWVHDSVNVPAVGGLPQLSDIAVAQSEGGTWTRDGQTFLRVSPTHLTNPDGSVHTYFEAYGVRGGTQYAVELRLAPSDAADRIWRLEPDDLGFRLQFTSQMSGEIGRHHLRLDLGDTGPGEYVLAVRIQDEDSGAYSLPAVTDLIVASR